MESVWAEVDREVGFKEDKVNITETHYELFLALDYITTAVRGSKYFTFTVNHSPGVKFSSLQQRFYFKS